MLRPNTTIVSGAIAEEYQYLLFMMGAADHALQIEPRTGPPVAGNLKV